MGSLFISKAPPRLAPPAEINRFFPTPQISYHPKTQNYDEILFFAERRTESASRLPCAHREQICGLRRSRLHRANRGSAALRRVRLLPRYQNNNLGWCEAPQAVEHTRETEKPPGTPSGRRLRLETRKSPVERLFPPSGGVSRGSVRVGGETFLLPSYGFYFGYKRKGVSIAEVTEAQRKIVGHKSRVNAITGRGYNPSVFSACKISRKASSPCTGKPKYALRKTSVSPVRLCAPHKSFPCAHFSFLIAPKAKIAIYRYRNRKKI